MSIFLSDGFTGTPGALATSLTPSVGGAWVKHVSETSNLVVNASGDGISVAASQAGLIYNDRDPGNDRYSVYVARGTSPSGNFGPCACVDPAASTFYFAEWSSSGQTIRLARRLAGANVTIGSVSSGHLISNTNGIGIEVDLPNSRMRVYKLDENNVEVEVVPWQTNTDITQRGYAGVTLYNTNTSAGAGITSISADNTLAATATSVTLSGPTSGTTGVASTNFTATTDQPVSTDTTITTVTAGTGTFSPSAPVILAGTSSITFTYTPSASQTANISITNSAGLTVLGSPIAYTSSAANTAPTFSGTIANISATQGSAISSVNVSSMFSDAESSLTFTAVGSWPSGITVSTAGVISGTPAASGTFGSLQVRATDAGGLTATSNAFTITVAAAATGSITTTPYRNIETGALMASTTIAKVYVIDRVNDTLAVLTNQTTNASGQLVINSLVAGRTYMIVAAEAVQSPVTDTGSAAGHFGAV